MKQIRKGAGAKAGKAARAAPTTDWLGFIRPHLETYRTLPWGSQRDFVEKLADREGQSANTLRRYIAAADFLESFGITQFPEKVGRMPVAAVEAIARISKKDAARGRGLLNDLLSGSGTIRGLRKQLQALPKRSAAAAEGVKLLTLADLHADIKRLVYENPEAGGWITPDAVMNDFRTRQGPFNVLSRQAWPRFVVPVRRDYSVVVFDEADLVWAASPAQVTQSFIRNIVAAAAMFDFVAVYCNALLFDVERAVSNVRHDCRRRISVKEGTLPFESLNAVN